MEPAWERLVHMLERIIDRLNVIGHIKAVKDSPDLRATVEDVEADKDTDEVYAQMTLQPVNSRLLCLGSCLELEEWMHAEVDRTTTAE